LKTIVILISGRGSNMQAIVEARLPIRIAAVVSNHADALGLQYATERGMDTAVVDHTEFPTREAFDAELAMKIDKYRPAFVLLAGFMRVLTPDFVDKYRGRLINIHPSLLPAFTGLRTHERALETGVTLHGCTVHFVTPTLDHGPIIIQAAVPVLPSDDAATLAARVLRQEHVIYPRALRWLIEGKVSLGSGQRVRFSGAAMDGGALISPREQE
jgi:phosphoribosylglycinamide formyltransferase 1